MRRIVLWVMSTLTVLVLLFGYRTSTAGPEAASGPDRGVLPIQGGDGSGTTGSTPSGPTGSSGSGGGSTSPSDTVTGDSISTRWGPVQVRITVSGRRITQVSVVDYPRDTRRDEEINARALPILVQETLKAQSAEVDFVSGATVTSDGYVTSLQSALDKAGF